MTASENGNIKSKNTVRSMISIWFFSHWRAAFWATVNIWEAATGSVIKIDALKNGKYLYQKKLWGHANFCLVNQTR